MVKKITKKIPTWTIHMKGKDHPKGVWFKERFLTGGKVHFNFKEAQAVKKKLQEMSSSFLYKVVKN